jgi:nascent polypeptide-associated complex subunit alpha
MLPGGMDPKKMEAMMRQMGIKQEKIEAKRVVIELDGKSIVIEEPETVKITMQGQSSYQISGSAKIIENGPSQEDIKMVMEQSNVSEEEAKEALIEAKGDIAQAILNLGEKG